MDASVVGAISSAVAVIIAAYLTLRGQKATTTLDAAAHTVTQWDRSVYLAREDAERAEARAERAERRAKKAEDQVDALESELEDMRALWAEERREAAAIIRLQHRIISNETAAAAAIDGVSSHALRELIESDGDGMEL